MNNDHPPEEDKKNDREINWKNFFCSAVSLKKS